MSSSSTSLNVLTIGGSRNIGYFSSLRMLAAGATVTFLLRNPSVFDNDIDIQEHIKKGKAFLLKGDALVKTDVERAWKTAANNASKNVDVMLFTVGGTPRFTVTKGFVIDPPNLVAQSLINVLCTLPHNTPQPRIIVISSVGLTRTSHKSLPFALKLMYGYLLQVPHKDKLGAERVVAHVADWPWNTAADGEPGEDIMGPGDWTKLDGLPRKGELKSILVIRPALLTDGECLTEKEGKARKMYRVSEQELGGYTVSRKDVAHFVVDAVLNRWEEFENKCVSIAY